MAVYADWLPDSPADADQAARQGIRPTGQLTVGQMLPRAVEECILIRMDPTETVNCLNERAHKRANRAA